MSLVDVRDTAAVAVSALSQNGHDGQIYEITGPESLSFANVAEILGRVLEKSIRYVGVPSQAAEAGMREAGMPAWNAAAVAELYGVFATGRFSGVTNVVESIVGRPALPFEKFVQDNSAAFA